MSLSLLTYKPLGEALGTVVFSVGARGHGRLSKCMVMAWEHTGPSMIDTSFEAK